MGRAVSPVGVVAAVVAAGLLALFLVFRTLFTDGPADPLDREYLVAHVVTAAGYAFTAWLLQTLAPSPRWLYPLVLAAPATAVVVLYGDAPDGVRALTGTVAVLGTLAGALAARRRDGHRGAGGAAGAERENGR
jgi:hypothetical protein